MKHAFLIIAHNEFGILQRLISALDDERIDIFVHIDRKVRNLPHLHVEKSGLFFVKDRVDVRWGHISQIECEYALFKEAYKPGRYVFYHLISGVHLPLKDINEILAYYDFWRGKIILPHLDCNDTYQMDLKVRRYNLFIKWFGYGPQWLQRCVQLFWRVNQKFQEALGITYNKEKNFRVSSNWVSLPEDALSYLISVNIEAMRLFRYSFCGDEWFAATMLFRSHLRGDIVSPDGILLCSIGDCNAVVFTDKDSDLVLSSGCLWARKFSLVDMDIVDKVLSR